MGEWQRQDEQRARSRASPLFILSLLNVFPHVSHKQTSEFSSDHCDTCCLVAFLHQLMSAHAPG